MDIGGFDAKGFDTKDCVADNQNIQEGNVLQDRDYSELQQPSLMPAIP